MTDLRRVFIFGLAVVFSAATALAQDGGLPTDDRITPERLGLPKGNTRTSEPFLTRIYKTDDLDDSHSNPSRKATPSRLRKTTSCRQTRSP